MPTNYKLAIIALGAYEQHSKHLPFETDTIIANAIIENLKSRLDNTYLFLPTQEIGYSPEHSFNSNSKTISYQQAIENIITQAQYCNNLGIKKLLIINTHGGNSPIMQIAAMEIREKMHMLCAYTSWLRFGIPDDLITTEDRAYDIHAGFIETSVMLHIAPNLVNMRKAKNFSNKQQKYSEEFKYLRAYGPHSFAWMMNDLNSDGACGNAANATAKAGEIIFTHSCNEIIELINDINKFDISF